MTERRMLPVPVTAAGAIAGRYGYDQVIVIARRVGEAPEPHGDHVTTYGVNLEHCGVAARVGDFLKHKVMGWPEAEQPDSVRFISVRENGEWGSFFVRSGITTRADDNPHHWCELTANTSFGCVGHYWSHMGRPAPEFLAKIGKDYLIDKLWGLESEVFDGDQALTDARCLVLDDRRHDCLSREEARDRWDELANESWYGEADFIGFVYRCDWLYQHLVEGGGPIGKVPNPQAEGFWKYLWPGFIRQLGAEA